MQFRPASDQSLLVYLGDKIGPAAHERVVSLLRLLEDNPLPWVRNLQPAYCSLLVSFDARQVDHAQVEAALQKHDRLVEEFSPPQPRVVEIPVCYGGEFGADLQDVAAQHSLTPDRVIELHASQSYRASFLGFAPGFAYLGDLPEQIATPRLPTPRKKVPPGSVAITGRQTAIYPFATPGGWRILGRTPLSVFHADRQPMELISIGDEVRFFPITPAQFQSWKKS